MSAYVHRGHVYFAVCGNFVKIGYTAQTPVDKRLDSILSSRLVCPAGLDRTQPVWLHDAIPGCVMRDERRVQGLFAAHHVVGEWFRWDRAFCDQQTSMRYVTYAEGLLNLRRARKAWRPLTAKAAA